MLLSILISAGLLSADLQDGTEVPVTDSLQAVTITADKGRIVSRTDTIAVANPFSISEVLLQCPGLHVGDNGGCAGLKTVSLRGLGSAHTSVYLDGVRLGNVQSGQNDLGMLDVENFSSIVVDYAQNSVSFRTRRPVLNGRAVAGKVRMSAGSFGTYQPSARLDFRLGDNLSMSANASGIVSKGDFSYGDGAVRTNNDLKLFRGGLDLFGTMSGGEYHVKAYINSSERGTPGSVSWPSEDRQQDGNYLLQGLMDKRFTPLYSLKLSAKASYDDIYYTSQWGDSRYGQTELQLNSAHDFRIKPWWKMSFAADIQWDRLNSTSYDASRLTAFSAIAASFATDRLKANVALEYSGTFDKKALSRNSFSPSVDVRYSIFKGLDILAFARRACRVPVFNELYYVGYGNPELRPEDAWLTDFGLDFSRSIVHSCTVHAKADIFYNRLRDKITSAPSPEDPNIWQPYNIGRVRSAGLDLVAGFEHRGGWIYACDAKYSYQSAVDLTSDSGSYGMQIPYIARHTVVLNGSLEWKRWRLAPLWQMRSGMTDGTGDVPSWNTLDIMLSKGVNINKVGSLELRFSVKNVFDGRYEVVSGYPMPGRSFIGGVIFDF
jgi:outer membrane cobalamin receptor